jgi:hypothetical protein
MTVLRGRDIQAVPLRDALTEANGVPQERYREFERLLG